MKVCPPSARSGPKSGGSGRARRHRHACGVRTLPRFGCRSEDTPTVRTTGEDTRSRPRPEKRKSRRWGARVVWGNGVVTVESLPVWIHLGFHIGSGATADRRKIRLNLLLPESGGPSASTGGGMASSSLSHLPWGMIPALKPGETDINEYTKRLEFLADLWPTEHLSHLAPRAAMLCEGGAFKRLMRVDAKKLKVNSLDGIKLLVSTLGGVWGKAKHEEKFERFERAIYSTVQRPDETHESYLARHDFQFEELAALHVTIDEMRAYCLLRNSGLLMDEKKKIIMDSDGQLEYGKVVAALKVLGSKFFTELQSSGKSSTRTKTYEAANVMEEDEPPSTLGDDDTVFPDHWDDDILLLSEENEQDALVIQQFEDSLVDVLQNDPETAQCFYSYLEARKRITERNKNRGFWPVKGSVKGKSKTKFGFSKGFGKSRKPLAQRILESECRPCGQKGRWKAECPRRFENEAKPANGERRHDFDV